MILLIDKPKWFTSFGVIKKLKRIYMWEKIWHAGTLDPMATGVLVIWIGKGTKKLHWLQGLDKSYTAHIDFSKLTDTWDMDFWDKYEEFDIENNKLLKDGKKVSFPSIEEIIEKLDSIVWTTRMPLPAFSAKKVKGKKLYDLARKGTDLKLERDMEIHSYRIVSYEFPILKVEVDVGSGTYIRSIAYWLGKELGVGGTLCYLRRTSVWDFVIS